MEWNQTKIIIKYTKKMKLAESRYKLLLYWQLKEQFTWMRAKWKRKRYFWTSYRSPHIKISISFSRCHFCAQNEKKVSKSQHKTIMQPSVTIIHPMKCEQNLSGRWHVLRTEKNTNSIFWVLHVLWKRS